MSFRHCQFRADPIRQAVRFCFRISLCPREFENLLTPWATDLGSATIQGWTNRFGPFIARRLKQSLPAPSPRWYLNEMVCSIGSRHVYLWFAVHGWGEVLDLVVQHDQDMQAALKLIKRRY